MRRIHSLLPAMLISASLLVLLFSSGAYNVSAASTYCEGSMIAGTNINYWTSATTYTNSVPLAISKVMYPPNLSNPLNIYKTTVKSNAKLEFYEVNVGDAFLGFTVLWAKNAAGAYWSLDTYAQCDANNWTYGEIRLNNGIMGASSWDKYQCATVIAHEILHAYGLKHVSDPSSIMYPQYNGLKDVRQAENDILNLKY